MNYWLEYQPLSIEFRNGAPKNARRIGFLSSLMAFNDQANTVAITQLATPTAERDRLVELFSGSELWAIRYKLWVYARQGDTRPVSAPLPYCHPFRKTEGVQMLGGKQSAVFLRQIDGKKFFSNRYELGDVTDGMIESPQPTYQFLD